MGTYGNNGGIRGYFQVGVRFVAGWLDGVACYIGRASIFKDRTGLGCMFLRIWIIITLWHSQYQRRLWLDTIRATRARSMESFGRIPLLAVIRPSHSVAFESGVYSSYFSYARDYH